MKSPEGPFRLFFLRLYPHLPVGVKGEGGQRRRWGGGGRGGGRGGGTALPEISSDVKFTERTVDGNDEMEIDRE